jgi:sterol 3beta-glucosyltransferase
MVVGNIHLSTHRLLFHALLPPDEAFIRHYDSAEDFETLGSTSTDPSIVLHAGAVTWHRHKLPSARVWMELSPEMITTYPSANEAGRVRPIKSILCRFP